SFAFCVPWKQAAFFAGSCQWTTYRLVLLSYRCEAVTVAFRMTVPYTQGSTDNQRIGFRTEVWDNGGSRWRGRRLRFQGNSAKRIDLLWSRWPKSFGALRVCPSI